MAKRDPEPEPVADETVEAEVAPVGERLRAAREERGISLEDLAAQTRIPQRHLASIEIADWDSLPAPTYTVGFAKSYAAAVGLDRTEIGNQLREEMGGQRFAASSADVFEPADPARTMPKGLVIGAVIAVVLLVAIMSWLNKRSLDQPEANGNSATSEATPPPAAQQPAGPTAAPASAQGPVVLTATATAWIEVTDGGKSLFEGELQPGQSYTVPQNLTAPMLKAGKPEALKVTVGSAVAPPVGPPGKVTTVSLLPAELMKGPAASGAPAAAAPAT
ncbi:MAG: helix-turn-helix domain-containing protein, partial [Sphingomicrobium sp.]